MGFSPQKFGKFILLDKIASGGMAEIFMAQTIGPGGFEKIVALKRILPSYGTHEEFISMFIDEAKVTSSLSHSNIVQIYDFGKINDNYYLSMEFVDGKNLRQLLARTEEQKRLIPLEHTVYIVSKICQGLDYAHRFRDKKLGQALQIIHRDVSPQNILISYEGEVKLIDFGIAKTRRQSGKTKSGVLKGKFGYMSPEQASGSPMDQRSDIFSTGIILFEMLTRQRLFTSNNDLNTLKKIQEAKIPAPSHFNPDIPFELEEIVLKSLQKNPELRYQTALEFHQELSRFLNTLNPDFTSAHVSTYVRSLFAQEILEHKKHMNEILIDATQLEQIKAHPEPMLPSSSERSVSQAQTVTKRARTEQTKTQQQAPSKLSEHPYPRKVVMQLGIMALAIVLLSTLLLLFNRNPDRIIQSILHVKEPPPLQKKESPLTKADELKQAVRSLTLEKSAQKDTAPKAPPTITEVGYLHVETSPASEIFIEEESIGVTPIVKFELPVGRYKVKAINHTFKVQAETEIEIKLNETQLLDENDLIFQPIPE